MDIIAQVDPMQTPYSKEYLQELVSNIENEVLKVTQQLTKLENKHTMCDVPSTPPPRRGRKRRAISFDNLAKRLFTRDEQRKCTSVIGQGGNPLNALCCNGCVDKNGKRKLGQRNMVIRCIDDGKAQIGKWCYKCITKSGMSNKRHNSIYLCTKQGCWEEGVGAYVTREGSIVKHSLTCGCDG